MEFKDEVGAATATKQLIAAAERAKLAVAFWGKGALKTLGLERAGLTLTILCNLDSGACNPKEIRRLQTVFGVDNVKTLARLHAKVYWTPEGALLGSSNASANGLAVEGYASQSWAEANLLIREPTALKELEDWFDQRWSEGRTIQETDLKRAEQLWRKRKSAAPCAKPITSDIIQAYRNNPTHPAWQKVRIVFWSQKLSPDGKKEYEQERKAKPFLKNYDCYEDWKEIEAGEQIIEFKIETDGADFSGYFKCPDEKMDTRSLTWVLPVNGLTLPSTPLLAISKRDQSFVKRNTDALLKAFSKRRKGWARVDIETFVAAMDEIRTPRPPQYSEDDPVFRELLIETADIGRAFKLPFRYFRSLITSRGGLGTARYLLSQPVVQSGFTDLWEEKIVDISVEALVLKPRWQPEFTPDQINTARQRLKTLNLVVDANGVLMNLHANGIRTPYQSART